MRALACSILCVGAILIAAPAWAAGGRYDPDYPICMESISSEGTRIDCEYASIEQCKVGTAATAGSCFNNPYYVAPPPAAAAPPQPEPAPPVKRAKSAKPAKSPQSPPPQPAHPQQR